MTKEYTDFTYPKNKYCYDLTDFVANGVCKHCDVTDVIDWGEPLEFGHHCLAYNKKLSSETFTMNNKDEYSPIAISGCSKRKMRPLVTREDMEDTDRIFRKCGMSRKEVDNRRKKIARESKKW